MGQLLDERGFRTGSVPLDIRPDRQLAGGGASTVVQDTRTD
jgi:hypothetical protein